MLQALLALALFALGEPAVAAAPEVSASEATVTSKTNATPTRILGAVASIEGVDAQATRRALALRLPDLPLYDRSQGAPNTGEVGLYAYFEIRRRDPETLALRIILSDGRAFRRELHPGVGDPARVIAGTLASLLPAIEEATVLADDDDVALPDALLTLEEHTGGSPPNHIEPEDPATSSPKTSLRDPQTPGDPDDLDDLDDPDDPDDPDAPRASEAPPPFVPASALELGISLGTSALFGTAPQVGWRGSVGHLGLDFRLTKGVLAGLELRLGDGRSREFRVLRLRSALAIGYLLRRRAFEAPISALVTVEPWWLRSSDSSPTSIGDGTPPRPLLGLGLRIAPGYSFAFAGGLHLRIGARLEAALSGEPRQGLRRPLLLDPSDGSPAITLGGLEFSGGLELTLWLPTLSANRRSR